MALDILFMPDEKTDLALLAPDAVSDCSAAGGRLDAEDRQLTLYRCNIPPRDIHTTVCQ